MTEPLRRLLDEDVKWHWLDTRQKAFQEVKYLVIKQPVLEYFDNEKEVVIQEQSCKKFNL